MSKNRTLADHRHYLKHRDEIVIRQRRYRNRLKEAEKEMDMDDGRMDRVALEMLRKEGWRK